jgi:hypothetical protein
MREHTKMWPIKELEQKDAEIERLKTEALAEKNSHYRSLQLWGEKEDRLKVLITELCDALEEEYGSCLGDGHPSNLLQRAREATR